MEIGITDFVTDCDAYDFSASIAERGSNVGRETWAAAISQAEAHPLLVTPEALAAMRQWAKETGAWAAGEIAEWSSDEVNALFIQLVAGDMRVIGLDCCDFDWGAHGPAACGPIYPCGIEGHKDFGRIFYHLGS